jgi:predicted Fe-Mo cluster-binding NifX family protein
MAFTGRVPVTVLQNKRAKRKQCLGKDEFLLVSTKGNEMAFLLSLITSLALLGVTGTSQEPTNTRLIVAVAALGPEMDSQVCPRFGQSSYFTIVDVESNHAKSVVRLDPNQTGYDLANELTKFKVNVVIVGKIGPNAFEVLRVAGVKVIQGVSGTVEEALGRFEAGDFEKQAANSG